MEIFTKSLRGASNGEVPNVWLEQFMNFSATSIHNCNRFILQLASTATGIHQVSKVMAAILQQSRGTHTLPQWCLVYSSMHALLFGTCGLLPAVFLRKFICRTTEVLMVAFANWPLSLAVAIVEPKICRPIDSSCLSRTTTWFFWTGQHCKIGAIL